MVVAIRLHLSNAQSVMTERPTPVLFVARENIPNVQNITSIGKYLTRNKMHYSYISENQLL